MTKLLPKSSTPGTNNTFLAKSSGVNLNNSSSATSTVKETTKPAAMTNTVDGVALSAVGVHWTTWSASRTCFDASDEAYARCIWIYKPLQSKFIDLLVQLDSVTFRTCQARE
jgi:hypothetical protein